MVEMIENLVELCFHEFCTIAGDSPCGCDGCPYGRAYGSEKCFDVYRKEKLAKIGLPESLEDFRPWRVDNEYTNYQTERRVSINTTYYNPSDLGWLDKPMNHHRKYGIYSTKEKAIEAAKEYYSGYKIYCEGKLV